jgi:hypothetical protein
VHRDRIWVAGGLTGPGQATDQVFVLSDDGTAWEPGPALPVAVGTTELVSVADTLFAVGARPLDPTGNPWTWALLEVEARWDERARLHDDRDDLVAVAHDGRVWLLGGDVSPADPPHRKGEAHGDSILVYDPATGAWAASGHTVRPRLQHSGVVDEGGRAWVFGGIRPGVRTSLDSVDVVALGAGAFGGPPPQPFGGPGAMAALVGGQIHLIGLWSPEIIEATHRRLDPASGTWTRLPDAPARMGLGKAVVWRDRIWIIGARRELPETTSDDVWIFDPAAPGG